MDKAQVRSNQVSGVVDWITVTSATRAGGHALQSLYRKHRLGSGKQARFFGFDGERDERGMIYGRRETDGRHIFIAPGEAATETWKQAVPVATKVTRLDLACDVWLKEARDQVVQSSRVVLSPVHEAANSYSLITGTKARSGGKKGDTLYVGSRTSGQFGRFYDKGLQKNTAPQGKWLRYEVEYKAIAAIQVASSAVHLTGGQLGEFVKTSVHDWFLARSVVPVFSPATDTPGFTVRSSMKQTTAKKKLAWLHSQVRPTVDFLFELGLGDDAMHSLGLELAYERESGYSTLRRANVRSSQMEQVTEAIER